MKLPISALLLLGSVLATSGLVAQEKADPASPPKAVPIRVENFLLLPEPKAAKTEISMVLGKARFTVFTPVRQEPGSTRLVPYTQSEFAKLGISADTFQKKAGEAADRKLAALQPDLIKDEAGKVIYAVYRGADPSYACLLTAPSLGKIFEKLFGKEIWVVTPDRNSLYVFPANASAMEEFAADLEDRFESNPFAASEEVYLLKADSREIEAVANFTSR